MRIEELLVCHLHVLTRESHQLILLRLSPGTLLWDSATNTQYIYENNGHDSGLFSPKQRFHDNQGDHFLGVCPTMAYVRGNRNSGFKMLMFPCAGHQGIIASFVWNIWTAKHKAPDQSSVCVFCWKCFGTSVFVVFMFLLGRMVLFLMFGVILVSIVICGIVFNINIFLIIHSCQVRYSTKGVIWYCWVVAVRIKTPQHVVTCVTSFHMHDWCDAFFYHMARSELKWCYTLVDLRRDLSRKHVHCKTGQFLLWVDGRAMTMTIHDPLCDWVDCWVGAPDK